MGCYNEDEWRMKVLREGDWEMARQATRAKWQAIRDGCRDAPAPARECGFCWAAEFVAAIHLWEREKRCHFCLPHVRAMCQQVGADLVDDVLSFVGLLTWLEELELEEEEDDALAEMAIG